MTLNHIESHKGIPLEHHLNGVAERSKAFANAIPMPNLPFPKEIWVQVAYLCGLYHDLAKSTPYFQDYLHGKTKQSDLSGHSLPSAFVAYFAIKKTCSQLSDPWQTLLPAFAFMVIRAHHGNLYDPMEALLIKPEKQMVLRQQLAVIVDDLAAILPDGTSALIEARASVEKKLIASFQFAGLIQRLPDPSLGYFLLRALFSCLIDADKLTTVLKETPLPERVDLPSQLMSMYRQNHTFPTQKLNPLRDELFLDLEQAALTCQASGIYTVTAPTGIGKTFSVLHGALQLRERIEKKYGYRPRIIYALPFLSVIDQNADVLSEVIESVLKTKVTSDYLITHHHLSPRTYKQTDLEKEHTFDDAAELLVEGWNSELVITTFHQVFNTLVGGTNRSTRRLHQMLGGILILDEVQSLPIKYWRFVRHLLEQITTHTPGMVLLSTATQPAILEQPRELIPHPDRFFKHHLMQRTSILYDKTEQKLSDFIVQMGDLLDEKDSQLIVLNTINDARNTYQALRNTEKYYCVYLSTHLTPKQRLIRIQEAKRRLLERRNHPDFPPVLVVSTQLIEAGVDLDSDQVTRDFGPFDSLIQVAGRSNRNAENDKATTARVVELIGERFRGSKIYDPVVTNITRSLLKPNEPLLEHDYLQTGQHYAEMLRKRTSSKESQVLEQALKKLDFDGLRSFRLIEEEQEKASVFIELDEEAKNLWQRFEDVQTIQDRWKRKKLFNDFKAEFYKYVIQVSLKNLEQNTPPIRNEMYYVSILDLSLYYDLETGFQITPGFAEY
jgi:CRISPR-associated endonuclease/helicase Cas3